MKKRMIALLMSVCLAASLISCGENPWKDNSSTPSGGSSTPGSSQEQQANEDRVTEITLPISEKKLSFSEWRAWSNDWMTNYGEVKGIIELENRTNVHVDYTCVPNAAAVEKYGLMLASGEYTDMIEGNNTNLSYPGGPDTAVADGVFVDMTDYVYKYMPNYFQLLKDRQDIKEIAITDEGRNVGIYMIRCYVDGKNQQVVVQNEPAWCGMAVRQDWLDELNMDLPRTIDQLYDVLVAFKNNYGAWMHLYTDGTIGSDYILSAYGVTQDFYVKDDGKTVGFGPLEPGYKEYVSLMHKWYSEGLIDPNFTSTDSSAILTAHTYYASDKCGVGMSFQGTCGDMHYRNGYTENEKMWLQPIEGPVLKEGDTTVTTFQSEVACNPQWITKSVAEADLPYLAQWLDYHFTYDYAVLASFGIEGESYVIDESNEWYFVYTDKVKYPETPGMTPGACRGTYGMFNNVGYMNWKSGFELSAFQGITYQAIAYDVWGRQGSDIMIPPSASFTPEESSEYSIIYPDIEAYVAESTVKFIVGTDDIDKGWDNFVKTIEGMNIQRCIDLKQTSLDRYYGKTWLLEGK